MDALPAVKQFAELHGLAMIEESHERRTIRLEGTAEAFAKAFGTAFDRYEHEGFQYRARTGAPVTSYNPRQVTQLYDFPLDVDGTGQSIAVIQLGGGYRPADLEAFFTSLSIYHNVKQPEVIPVLVDGGATTRPLPTARMAR